MKEVEVGLIDSDELSDPQMVLDLLDARQQSAIAIRFPEGIKLVYRGAIQEMMDEGSLAIDITRRHSVEEVQYVDVTESTDADSSGYRGSSLADASPVFDFSGGIDFLSVSVNPTSVEIMTRSELLAEVISSTGGYSCNGIKKHSFPDPSVRAGDSCPRLGCKAADGTRGIISAF